MTAFVLGRPWLTLLLSAALSLLAAAGVRGLSFDPDYRAFFSDDNADLLALEALEKRFSRAETLVIGIAPPDGRVFTPARLQAIRDLTDAWSRLPYAKGAASIGNYIEARSEGDDLLAEPLLPDDLGTADLAAIEQRAKADERLRGGLLSDSGDVAGVYLYFELPRRRSSATGSRSRTPTCTSSRRRPRRSSARPRAPRSSARSPPSSTTC